MQILYCDSCGFRIPEKDITEGRALRTPDGKMCCEKCVPGKVASRSSSHKMAPAQRSTEKSSSAQLHAVSTKSAAGGAARHAQPSHPAAKSNATMIGIALGVVTAVLLIVIMSGGSRRPSLTEDRADSHSSSIAPPAPAPVAPLRPNPPKASTVEPAPHIGPQADLPAPTPVEASPDEKAFDKLLRFEGVEATDTAGHIAQIEAFLETYKDSILSSRARTLLGDWKAKAAGTSTVSNVPEAKTGEPKETTPPQDPIAAKARVTFVGTDDKTYGHWKGVYGQDGYYVPGFLDKRLAPNGAVPKDPATDLKKLPAYVASFTTDNEEIRGIMNDLPGEAWIDAPEGTERHLCYDVVPTNGSMTYKLTFKDDKPHRLALYFGIGIGDREVAIEIRDATSQELLDRRLVKGAPTIKGVYLIWEITGNVCFVFRAAGRLRAFCSGVFFGGGAAAAGPAVSTTTGTGEQPATAPDPDTAARLEALKTSELIAELRKEARPLIKSGRFTDALKVLEEKAKLERYATIKDAAALEVNDLKILIQAKTDAIETLRAQEGKTVTLSISGREITGLLKNDPKRGDMSLRMSGGAEIAFSPDLLELRDLLAQLPRAPGQGLKDDLRRRGLMYLYIGNAAMAKSSFAGAKEAGLENAERYLKQAETLELGEQEEEARALWEKGEAHLKSSEWAEAEKTFQNLRQRYGTTKWVIAHEDELKSRLVAAEKGLNPRAPGVLASYYKGKDFLEGDFLMSMIETNIDRDFGDGSPSPRVPPNQFSGRYTGSIKIPATGRYTFSTFSDDGTRMSIDGKVVFEKWVDHALIRTSGDVDLSEGFHNFVLDYFDGGGGAEVHLLWAQKDGFAEQLIPGSVLFHNQPALPFKNEPRVYLSDLTETSVKVGHGSFVKGTPGNAGISVANVKYNHWLYAHADSSIVYNLGKQFRLLSLGAALSDTGVGCNRVTFTVLLDDKAAWFSGEVKHGAAPIPVILNVTGVEKLELRVGAKDRSNAHTVWIEPFLTK